jgi:hypothetical protein
VVQDEVGAPFVQGYLMHRPMPVERLLEVVRANRRREPRPPEEPPGAPDELLVRLP